MPSSMRTVRVIRSLLVASGEQLVVDEAGRAEADGHREQGRAVDRVSSSQRRRHPRRRRSRARRAAPRTVAHRIRARRASRRALTRSATPRERRGARVGGRARRRAPLARGGRCATTSRGRRARERWSGRRPRYADREVAGHAPDDEQLLGVLLAEVRAIGADQVEQDRDDRSDTVEMARAVPRPRAAPRRRRRGRSCRSRAGRPRRRSGAKTRSAPSSAQIATSRASLRGYCSRSAGSPNCAG